MALLCKFTSSMPSFFSSYSFLFKLCSYIGTLKDACILVSLLGFRIYIL
uniref:Uncharacterized protein n=1 Tax=Arundo donax TaxID=35708 RepID=A0A0A9EFL0_ARUDO